MKISFYTLGCRLNHSESDILASNFKNNGYNIVDFDKKAQIKIINTCTVTAQAGKKSRNIIYKALKELDENEDSYVFVTGCHSKFVKNELDNTVKNFDRLIIIDNLKKAYTYDMIESYIKKEVFDKKENNTFIEGLASPLKHTKLFIKIQDGCNNKCSFCIIPEVRGKAVSQDFNKIIDNVEQALISGYKEIVLTGINIGRYESDNKNIKDLIKEILKIEKDFRLSISSIEPYGIDEDFIALFENDKLIKHLHICLQSGSDRILLQMRREYLYKEYKQIIEKIRSKFEIFNISTDIIVGFPNETEEDFNKTLQAIKENDFSWVHVFPYSDRNNTRSSRMQDKINKNIKDQRAQIITELIEKQKMEFIKKTENFKRKILIEEVKDAYAYGYDQFYVKNKIKDKNYSRNDIVEI